MISSMLRVDLRGEHERDKEWQNNYIQRHKGGYSEDMIDRHDYE